MNTFKINKLELKNVFYPSLCESIENNDNYFYISKQYYNKKYDKLPYNYFILNNIEDVEQITKTNNNLYEVLQNNKPIKPFLDIDLYIKDYDFEIDENMLLKYVLDEYTKIYFNCFNIEIELKDYIVICGTTNKKISFHIIVNNGHFFFNNTQQKEFIKYIHFKNIVLKNNVELKNIIDLNVYSRNKNFRLTNQSKMLKDYEKEKTIIKEQINEAKQNKEIYEELEQKLKKIENNKLKTESTLKIISRNHTFKETLLINHFIEDPNILNCSFLNTQTKEIEKLNKEYKHENIIYINNDVSNLNKVLSLIPTILFGNFYDWCNIGKSVKNINCDCEGEELFNFYSKGHPNYNEEENKIYFKSFKGNNSWGYLFSLIDDTKINKIIKKQLKQDYKKYDAIENTSNFKIINDENKYINEKHLTESTEKHIILKAHPGKGKTRAIQEFINFKKKNTKKNIDLELEQINIKIQNKLKFIEVYNEKYERFLNEGDEYSNDVLRKHQTRLNNLYEQQEYIKKNNCCVNDVKLLILSSRITFAEHLSHIFKVENYKDLKEKEINIKNYSNSIIISVESLHLLNFGNVYDVIIIDEVESILNQFSSYTCKLKNECYKNLFNFITNSNKIIYADAFVGERTFKFINFFNGSKLLIKNEVFENNKKAFIYNNEEELILKLEEDLKNKLKVYVHFTSCKLGQNIINNIIEKGILKPEEIIYYSSNETIKDGEILTNNKKLNNINVEWKKYKLICSTSSLTVGNSYENLDINNIYIFGGITHFSGCCVRDSFQNHMRVRHNQGDLYVFLPPGKKTFTPDLLNFDENNENHETDLKNIQKYNLFKYSFEDLEIYYLLKSKKLQDNKLKIFLNNCIDYEEYEKLYIKFSIKERQEILKKYNILLKQFEIMSTNYNNSLHEIIKINAFERHININLYNHVFKDYLNKMFYKIQYVRTNPKRLAKFDINPTYDNINNIDNETLKEHINNQKINKISNKQLNEINKAFFNKMFQDVNKDEKIIKEIYDEIFMKVTKKEQFKNIILEFNYYNNTNKFKNELKNHFESIKNNQCEKSIIYNKLQEITQLNKALNISCSFNECVMDVNETFKNFKKYIKKENKINNIKTLFNMSYNINNIDDLKYNRTFISKIYNNFNGSTIINEEVKKTKTTFNALKFRLQTILMKEGIMGDDCKIKDYLKIYKSIEEYKKNMTEYDFID